MSPYRSRRVDGGLLRARGLPGRRGLRPAEVPDDRAGDRERVLVACRVVVGDARLTRVDVGAPELLRGHVLAGRRFHERRPADEDRAGAADDHRLVAHRRHVRTARRARPHHDGDLRNALRGHAGLVVEDPAEVFPVGEHLGLERQERAAGVDEVDARQPVLLGDLLGTEVLLDRDREVRAALHRRVVGDEHALAPLDDADSGDDPGGGRLVVVEPPRGERGELEERGVRVDEQVDPLAGGQLPARAVALDRLLASARRDERRPLPQLGDEAAHPLAPLHEEIGVPLDLGGEQHRAQRRRSCGRRRSAFHLHLPIDRCRCGLLGEAEKQSRTGC